MVGMKPQARLSEWKWIVKIHDRIMLAFYVYILLKYRLLALIMPGSLLDDYQYLDCFLVGRYKFIGRSDRCSGQLVTGFVLLFGIYRVIVIYFGPKSKFYATEFLLNDYEDVQSLEPVRMEPPVDRYGGFAKRKKDNYSAVIEDPISMVTPTTKAGVEAEAPFRVDPIFYLRSPFQTGATEWILRPNRTAKSWLILSKSTQTLTALALAGLFFWQFIIWYMIGGSILSNMGYELSYWNCVSWLRSEQTALRRSSNNNHNNYSYIYLAPRVLASELRVDDLPSRIEYVWGNWQQATGYQLIRSLADILENEFVYLEFFFAFTASLYLLTIHSIDVLINGNSIKTQLEELLDRLNKQPRPDRSCSLVGRGAQFARHLNGGNPYQLSMRAIMTRHRTIYRTNTSLAPAPSWGLSSEVVRLQAILVDHFQLTTAYNYYMSGFFIFQFACWFSYTAVVCFWMGSVRSRAIEKEFVIVETGATALAVVLFSTAAIVRSRNAQLYPLMTQLMANDLADPLTKLRWLSLIRYYYPKSLYCFTLFETNEISWLYCLKLVSWILSAFVVLASFFYQKRP